MKSYLKKIMAENFPSLVKEIDTQVQEAQSPPKDEPKETTPRHIISKTPRVKERILKAASEKQVVT